ncbi:MAG: arginase family protein, partial [Acidobacteria bacterium]|nr:arginase family protein [Acidobacteriota bacterium]
MKRPAVSIAGVRLDLGAGRRGTDMGPSAVRLAGLHEALRDAGFEDVEDLGDIDGPGAETADPGEPHARFLVPISATCRRGARRVRGILGAGRVPVVIGGDHSLAAGSISGVAAHHRRAGGRVGVIWVDAPRHMKKPQTYGAGNAPR